MLPKIILLRYVMYGVSCGATWLTPLAFLLILFHINLSSSTNRKHHTMGFVDTNNHLLFYFSKDLRFMENNTCTQILYN
jgi:hypothetical protein